MAGLLYMQHHTGAKRRHVGYWWRIYVTWTSLIKWWVTETIRSRVWAYRAIHILVNLYCASFPQGQTAFDVADEDVLGYLEELQKKQNLVSQCCCYCSNRRCQRWISLNDWFLFSLFQLMSGKKDVKKSPLIETTTTGDNNQSLKPLKR